MQCPQDGQHLDQHRSTFSHGGNMNKASLTVLISLSMLAGAAYAQQDGSISMSTDPAKAADVEQRAQALQAKQETHPQSTPMKHHKPHHHKEATKDEGSATPTPQQDGNQ
jgi:hypothetical protein